MAGKMTKPINYSRQNCNKDDAAVRDSRRKCLSTDVVVPDRNVVRKKGKQETIFNLSETLGSHGGMQENDWLASRLLRRLPTFHRPDDEGSKHLRNFGKLLPDYTVQKPRR
jgi:hypothetical protein